MEAACTIQVMGEGNPTVILNDEQRRTYLDWELVKPEVAISTRVFTHDR
jgi:hypothetical protein